MILLPDTSRTTAVDVDPPPVLTDGSGAAPAAEDLVPAESHAPHPLAASSALGVRRLAVRGFVRYHLWPRRHNRFAAKPGSCPRKASAAGWAGNPRSPVTRTAAGGVAVLTAPLTLEVVPPALVVHHALPLVPPEATQQVRSHVWLLSRKGSAAAAHVPDAGLTGCDRHVLPAPFTPLVPLTLRVQLDLPLVDADATPQVRSHTGMVLALRAAAKTPGG